MTLPEVRDDDREEDADEEGREEEAFGLEPRDERTDAPVAREGEDMEPLGLEDVEGRDRIERDEDPEPVRLEEGEVTLEARPAADDRPAREDARLESRRPLLPLGETAVRSEAGDRPELDGLRREGYPAVGWEDRERLRRSEVAKVELRTDDADAWDDGYFLIVSPFFTGVPADCPSFFLIF